MQDNDFNQANQVDQATVGQEQAAPIEQPPAKATPKTKTKLSKAAETAADEDFETTSGRMFITNLRDAKRKQNMILALLVFFLLTLIVPHLNPIPQVQTLTKDKQGRVVTTNKIQPSEYAKLFTKEIKIGSVNINLLSKTKPYKGAFELMINLGSIPNFLKTQLPTEITTRGIRSAPAMAANGSAGMIAYGIYAVLYAQLALLALGVYGLIVSKKQERQMKGVKLMRISAWGFAISYIALIAVLLTFNLMVGYILIFGVPFMAIVALALSFVYIRQVFMFRWYTHPETVMKKEIKQFSYFKNQAKKECEYCHAEIPESYESCPQCGRTLVERWKCRNCGLLNAASREICYSCGHPPRKL